MVIIIIIIYTLFENVIGVLLITTACSINILRYVCKCCIYSTACYECYHDEVLNRCCSVACCSIVLIVRM